jgi:hypothetical protein
MRRKRAHVILPEDLLAEVDRLVGERGRSAFLAEVVRQEVQRRNLLAALREAKGSWKTEDHPELAEGSEAFVDRLRPENDERLKSLPTPDAHALLDTTFLIDVLNDRRGRADLMEQFILWSSSSSKI